MANLVTVTFDGGANGTNLSTFDANWTKVSGHTGNLILAGNRIRPDSTGASAYYHSASPTTADYSVSVDLVYLSALTNVSAGPIGRCSTSDNTFYMARFAIGNGWQMYKFVAGTATQLGSTVSASLSAGSTTVMKLDMVGTAIKLFLDGSGTPTINATDSAISAAGKSGVRVNHPTAANDTTGIHLDNFSADEAGSGAYTLTVAQIATATSFGAVGFALASTLSVAQQSVPIAAADVGMNLGRTLAIDAQASPIVFGDVGFSQAFGLVIANAAVPVSFAPVGLTSGGNFALSVAGNSLAISTAAITLRFGQKLAIAGMVLPVAQGAVNLLQTYRLNLASLPVFVQNQAIVLRYSGAPQPVSRTKEVGLRYVPGLPPSNASTEQALEWALQELQRASTVINNLAEGRVAPLNAPPDKPFDGMIRMADGVNWNPGNGRGYYGYDARTGTWKFFG